MINYENLGKRDVFPQQNMATKRCSKTQPAFRLFPRDAGRVMKIRVEERDNNLATWRI
jgi:hypothetical protein